METYGLFNLNGDDKKRAEILGLSNKEFLGGVERFEIGLSQLTDLINNNFIRLDEHQNNSPTTQEFFDFMKKYPIAKAHGYAVSKERKDYCVVLEGLMINLTNEVSQTDILIDFIELCRHADDLEITKDELYSWWD